MLARVWVIADNRLTPVRVKTGISDGTSVAIVGGELSEGAQVVTGAAAPAAASAVGSSPLLPQRLGRNGGQGQRAAGTGRAGR